MSALAFAHGPSYKILFSFDQICSCNFERKNFEHQGLVGSIFFSNESLFYNSLALYFFDRDASFSISKKKIRLNRDLIEKRAVYDNIYYSKLKGETTVSSLLLQNIFRNIAMMFEYLGQLIEFNVIDHLVDGDRTLKNLRLK